MDIKSLLLFILLITISSSFNVNRDSLVVARKSKNHHRITRYAKETSEWEFEDVAETPQIYEMTIKTDVTNRYAKTLVVSKVRNAGNQAQEAVFAIILPEKAFISKFVMAIDGKDYEAYVKEKDEAKQIYKQAVDSGLGAAHVAASVRDSNRFTVSVNIQPSSKATFYLAYEQLLERKDNKYEIVINIHPKQPVKDLFVNVYVEESLPLKFLHAPPIRSGNDIRQVSGDLDSRARVQIISSRSGRVTFRPTVQRQKEIGEILHQNTEEGMSGQFIVEYDVERNQGGEVLLEDGYFIHFFAPPDVEPLPKNVFFVLDTSGSMDGAKIQQLKEAMNKILTELKPKDKFSLILFNFNVEVFDITNGNSVTYYDGSGTNLNEISFPKSVGVTSEAIESAKIQVNGLYAAGGTNIADALKVTLHQVNQQIGNLNDPQALIIFLTDGEATSGITDRDQIIEAVTNQNIHNTPIYCLSFGSGADRDLLQKLSLKNNGFSRHIYEAADAALQLEDFYSHISSPVMNNITFKYISDVKDVTKTSFPMLFNGSEIVVTGKIDKDFPTLPTVTARGANGSIDFVPEIRKPVAKLERLWAYVTIQQLLEEKEIAENPEEIQQKALDIALQYSFVTPVSSMVVVKPNSTDEISLEAGHTNMLSSSSPSLTGFQPVITTSTVATTKPSTTTTTARPRKVIHTIEQLKHNIPWLNSTMEDDVLYTEYGNFKIGLNERSPDDKICPVTPKSGMGHCKHLHECPDVLKLLASVHIFTQYHCELDGFAAICCPPEKPLVQ